MAIATIRTRKRTPNNGITYKLLPGQARAYLLDKKHTAFVGGVGSGKTFFGALWAQQQAISKDGHAMIIAPTYRMLEDVTLPEFKAFLERSGTQHHHDIGRGQIQTGNGTIFLRSAENPERLRGPNLTWAWMDEAALMKEDAWKVMLGRLRIGGATSLSTTTPRGFNWLYKYWVEKKSRSYGIVHASSRENPYLDNDFVEALLEDYSDDFALQEVEGHFVAFEGLIYNEFRDGVHSIEPFEIPRDWTRYRAIDFGYVNPFACLWCAKDPDGRLYFYDEHYATRMLLSEHAEKIRTRDSGTGDEKPLRYQLTVADHDAQDVAELAKYGIKTTKARKEVSVGIQKVKNRMKVQKDGKPRIFFFNSMVHTIKELYPYRRTDKATKEATVKESEH
ncbi:MAG: hypothetical protein GY771_08890, partial [bacterium]|nr:hypothetical protein [bacterium]